MYNGIDVSHHQGKINFNKVKESGYDFVIIRTGYGKNISGKDRNFEEYYSNAKSAGMNIGAYHYSYAKTINDAKLEAENFLNITKGKTFDYPVWYDVEDKSQMTLSKEDATNIALTFMNTVQDANYYIGLYSNPDWLQNRFITNDLKPFDIWLAQWNTSESNKYNINHGIWQYNVLGTLNDIKNGYATKTGRIDGIEGPIDVNISYVYYPEIIKNKSLNGFANCSLCEDLKNENIELKNTISSLKNDLDTVNNKLNKIKNILL